MQLPQLKPEQQEYSVKKLQLVPMAGRLIEASPARIFQAIGKAGTCHVKGLF